MALEKKAVVEHNVGPKGGTSEDVVKWRRVRCIDYLSWGLKLVNDVSG